MTPIEIIRKRENSPKPCRECEKSVRYNGVLLCTVSEKIILPMFEDVQVCRGKYLEVSE